MRVGLETLMGKDKEITKGTPGSMNGTFSRRLELGCQKYKIMLFRIWLFLFQDHCAFQPWKWEWGLNRPKWWKLPICMTHQLQIWIWRCNTEIMTVFLFSIYLMLQGSDGGHRVNAGHVMPEGSIKKLLKLWIS